MGIYSEAGDIIAKIKNRKGTVKGLLYNKGKEGKKKSIMAIVCETLKWMPILDNLVDVVFVGEDFRPRQKCVIQAMIFDLMFGKKKNRWWRFYEENDLKEEVKTFEPVCANEDTSWSNR